MLSFIGPRLSWAQGCSSWIENQIQAIWRIDCDSQTIPDISGQIKKAVPQASLDIELTLPAMR